MTFTIYKSERQQLPQVAHPRWPIWAYWILQHRSISFNDMGPIVGPILANIGQRYRSTSIIDTAQYRVSTALNIGQ